VPLACPALSRFEEPAFDAEAFIGRLGSTHHYDQLLATLDDVAYFAKDERGRFVQANQEFAQMLGVTQPEEVIGRCDRDFFPVEIAARFVADDHTVMGSGEPLVQHIEPVPRPDRTFMWRRVSKVPLRDTSGRVVGVAGVSVRLHGENVNCHPGVFAAMEHIGRHYGQSLTVGDLAALADLSPRAFERNFVRTFKTSPLRYLNTVRLRAARHLLLTTPDNLADIATTCGFCDQSHMTAQFSRCFGTTPRRYRLSRPRAA
jgi:PAS domain S-box-containing protein